MESPIPTQYIIFPSYILPKSIIWALVISKQIKQIITYLVIKL